MDNKSFEMLEFPRIREILAGYTSFSTSRDLALSLEPSSDYATVSLLLRQSEEAQRLLTEDPDVTLGDTNDLREPVRLASLGEILEAPILILIQRALASMRLLRSSVSRLRDELPLLWKIAEGIQELRPVEKHIETSISPLGEVLDSASPRLLAVRRELREARTLLVSKLEEIVHSPQGSRIVQDAIVTEREGRFVIPVKIEARREIKGIVHDVSNTGATAFIEPWATVEQGNELRELSLEERRETSRILRELSEQVGQFEAEITRSIICAAELDLAFAKARYARRNNAAVPAITRSGRTNNPEEGRLRLVRARHPLLGSNAVPLDLEIGGDHSTIVITGPNTGGKTVALKTVGLLSAMTQAGIPVPAAPESCIPVFDTIYADIGDEQSIEQTLSTFSWHIKNIGRFVTSATSRSLVLLDELGTSTDPTEGSALACAILLHLLQRGTFTVATTHYSDMKAFAHQTPGMQNASLEFDPLTLTPTYRLIVGLPGGSNALATAARLGLPEEIIGNARQRVSVGSQELETLLADLNSEKTKMEKLRRSLEQEYAACARQSEELATELQRIRQEERKVLQAARDRVVEELSDLQKTIKQATSDLKKEKSRERLASARQAAAAVREQLRTVELKPQTGEEEEEEEIPEAATLEPGDTVRLKEADLRATVLSLREDSDEIEVQAGPTRMTLSISGVEKVSSSGKTVPVVSPVKRDIMPRQVALQLDLRGKRADEVDWLLEDYLHDAYLAGMPEVRIVHGYGTGVVRTIVRQSLASHSLVHSFRPGGPGEGGDGATVVIIKKG